MRRVMCVAVLVFTIAGCAHMSRHDDREPTLPTKVKTPNEAFDLHSVSVNESAEGKAKPAAEPISSEVTPIGRQGDTLTLAALQDIAIRNNPTLRQAQARIDVARGRWLQGGLRPNPVVGFTGNEIGNEAAAGQNGFFVRQKFITYNKLGLNQQVAAREIERAEQQAHTQRLRVITDVQMAYYDLLISQRRVAIANDMKRLSDDAVKFIGNLLAGRQTTRVALLQAEVEAEAAQIVVSNAINGRKAAWRQLAAVLGTPKRPLTRVAGEIDQELPTIKWDQTVRRLRSQSPEMAAAVANVERARWALDRAAVETKPDVNVQLGVSYDDSSNDVFSGVQVLIPLPIHNRNQGNILSARADVISAEQDVTRITLDLQRRLASVYKRYRNGRQQAERYNKAILPKAKETLKLVILGYKAGEKEYPYVTLLTAQRTLFNAQLGYLSALSEIWAANVEVQGMLLKESLSSPVKR